MEFLFKGFSVKQSRSAIKVNSDGVLIAAWSSLVQFKELTLPKILDVGSGTGVISLIMAKRLSAYQNEGSYRVIAVEIDRDSYEESVDNFSGSPWSGSLFAFNTSLQNFAQIVDNQGSFDLIVTNPPYFSNSLKADNIRRSTGRHDDTLSIEELLESSLFLLKEGGKLSVIVPPDKGERILSIIKMDSSFFLTRLTKLYSVANRPVKRYLMELTKGDPNSVVEEGSLIMQPFGGGLYTEQYVDIVGEYYYKPITTYQLREEE